MKSINFMSLFKSFQQTKFYKWIYNVANSNKFAKIIASLFVWVVIFIPVYFYLIVRWMIGPEGFWQEFALIAGVCILLGWVQILFLILGISVILAMLFS